MRRILIVEDEPAISDVVEFALRRAGFETRCVGSMAAARQALGREGADFVVLDLGLPDDDGLELCRELQRGSRVPVLMLTCRDQEMDRVVGLESGADDYMAKPFSTHELVARVRSILRRVEAAPALLSEACIRLGRVTMNPDEHRVLLDEAPVRLTALEFAILRVLLSSPDRVFTRDALIEKVWRDRCFIADRAIDSHVKGVRRKFSAVDSGADPVETVFGVGYRARKVE